MKKIIKYRECIDCDSWQQIESDLRTGLLTEGRLEIYCQGCDAIEILEKITYGEEGRR